MIWHIIIERENGAYIVTETGSGLSAKGVTSKEALNKLKGMLDSYAYEENMQKMKR